MAELYGLLIGAILTTYVCPGMILQVGILKIAHAKLQNPILIGWD